MFVEQDCSRRSAALLLRKSVPMPKQCRQGDLVCYMRRQGGNTLAEVWRGPSRVIGADHRVIWVVHNGIPVATAVHRMRPATAAEMMGYQVMSRNMIPFDGNDPSQRQPGKQQGFVDATEGTDAVPAPPTPAHDPDVRPSSSQRRELSTMT